ncbi:MAG: DUF433 domain-containing protein [Planctomycetes bacterium]|nr:DUF433 domain-containing protein [Planctomycetota bacterium]
MGSPTHRVDHPYVSRRPGMAGGSPVIAGTKFPVRSLVQYVLKQGMSPEEVVREFAQLSLPAVYDALSYYYDHQAELEAEMEDNTEARWREET